MSDNSKGKIVLTFESDWHIGTGTGIPGSTDKLIFRDADGFPAVPAKTLNGIWRDALETLCDGLENGWSKWVEFIYGNQPAEKGADPTITPFQSILTLRPARISENLHGAIGDDKAGKKLKQALTFIKAGIEIDNESGTAKENHLRFEEMGRSGTVLEAEFDLQTNNETAKALLVLSGEFIERIGGKRRRGAGKCKVEILDKDGKSFYPNALKVLEDTKGIAPESPKAKPDNPDEKESKDELKSGTDENKNSWQTLEYRLTLQTPVSIVTAVLGNVSESLDFIPGTYLLPHITKNLAKNVRSAVANGDFQVSPATIEVEFPKINEQGKIEKDQNGKNIIFKKRGFPIPKVFAHEKMKKEIVYNRLVDKFDENTPQTKPIREGFVTTKDDGTILHATNSPTLMIHNTVDDKVQRPTSEVGGVFSRQAIKAGTVLRGEIRWKKGIVKDDFNFTDLNGYVRLGTSKKDDYGLADFEVFEKETVGKDERKFEKQLIVYLASDVLLRNDNLRQTNLIGDLAKELSGKLGVDLTEVKPEKGLISSIIQVRRIESWQVSWGFPRPTLTAMSAGSVVVFKSDKDLNLDNLQKIEANGIGERRGEGYGQIIFNPQILEVSKPDWQKGKLTEAEKPKGNGKLDDDFSKQIELTAWREELKVAVLKIAANPAKRNDIFGFVNKSGKLSMSQIGGLRSAISRLKSETDEEKQRTKKIVSDWLKHLEETKNRFDNWGKERIDKVKDVLKDGNIWTKLQGFFNEPKSLTNHNLKNELWAEAVRALFYACQHAHKRDLEKPEQKKEAANG